MTTELQDVPPKPDAPELQSGASLAAPIGSASFRRIWSMPNSDTFDVPEIEGFVKKYLMKSKCSVDPFARNKRWATHTNDLNPATAATHHLDALDFLKMLAADGVRADLVIFDPPYAVHQVKECYAGIGVKFMQSDVYRTAGWTNERRVINEILTADGIVLSFGWNTIGMGKGYEIIEGLVVCHGACHNDTLCMAEQRRANLQGALL